MADHLPVDTILVLKLLLTPFFIGVVSWFARRFGARAGGWLAGLPMTSGPISVFLALEQGPAFAAQAAPGTILGIFPVAFFCLAWARFAHRGPWAGYGAGLVAYVAMVPWLRFAPVEPWPALVITLGALLGCLLAMPHANSTTNRQTMPQWDVPLRMGLATGLVVLLTGVAHVLGPAWTGILSPFPVFASVLALFHQRHEGPGGAVLVLRGILIGVFSFCAFFFIVAELLLRHPLWVTYAVASLAAVALNGVNGILLRRSMPVRSPDAEA